MGIGLATPRILLRNLGVSDFGACDVITAVVSSCAFFAGTFGIATSRFLNCAMGRNNPNELRNVFSMLVEIHAVLAICAVAIGECVGMWYFRSWIVIPQQSVSSGTLLMHAMIVNAAVQLVVVPFNALIVSHENMFVFSLFAIAESVFHFAAAICAGLAVDGRLGAYGLAYSAFSILLLVGYVVYDLMRYPESRFRFVFRGMQWKTVFGFISCNAIGNTAWMSSSWLTNIMLNYFFGPAVNAATGIANQVCYYVGKFTQNFLTASRPQIVKYHETGPMSEFESAVGMSMRIGFMLFLLCAVPVVWEADFLLRIWLGTYVDCAVGFVRVALICGLFDSLGYPVDYGMQAHGRIFKYECLGSGVRFLTLPVVWVLLMRGCSPVAALSGSCLVSLLCLASRFLIMKDILPSGWSFARKVFPSMLSVGAVTFGAAWLPSLALDEGWSRLLLTFALSSASVVCCGWFWGIDAAERRGVSLMLRSWLSGMAARLHIARL
ncbi:MAG: hypothetical protein MJ025_01275 [Victivallaceae bacterium]|nr:hypothetical protein [Victivallaceae bacterium]